MRLLFILLSYSLIFLKIYIEGFWCNKKAKESDNLSNEEINYHKRIINKITENYEEMVLNLSTYKK